VNRKTRNVDLGNHENPLRIATYKRLKGLNGVKSVDMSSAQIPVVYMKSY